jgi:hypothetical protein
VDIGMEEKLVDRVLEYTANRVRKASPFHTIQEEDDPKPTFKTNFLHGDLGDALPRVGRSAEPAAYECCSSCSVSPYTEKVQTSRPSNKIFPNRLKKAPECKPIISTPAMVWLLENISLLMDQQIFEAMSRQESPDLNWLASKFSREASRYSRKKNIGRHYLKTGTKRRESLYKDNSRCNMVDRD